jgi:hypothetical protein
LLPVLLVTGPIGVGKTAVLHEADALLVAAGAGHATVELEEIATPGTTFTPTSVPSHPTPPRPRSRARS